MKFIYKLSVEYLQFQPFFHFPSPPRSFFPLFHPICHDLVKL